MNIKNDRNYDYTKTRSLPDRNACAVTIVTDVNLQMGRLGFREITVPSEEADASPRNTGNSERSVVELVNL